MFSSYAVSANGMAYHRFDDDVSLAGYVKGIIFRSLERGFEKDKLDQPFAWTLAVSDVISMLGMQGNAVIIDAKPKSETELLLMEIKTIHGYCHFGWTPFIMELQPILFDVDPKLWDRDDFRLEAPVGANIAVADLYLRGSFEKGQKTGGWQFGSASTTSGAFKWLEARAIFNNAISLSRETQIWPSELLQKAIDIQRVIEA